MQRDQRDQREKTGAPICASGVGWGRVCGVCEVWREGEGRGTQGSEFKATNKSRKTLEGEKTGM